MTELIRAIIIDDEFNSRSLMGRLLETFPDVEVLDSADNADDGIKLVQEKKPDLIFLDISMPGKDGFDLVSELKSLGNIPDIIFVTAFDQFAIQAFKVSAFDYLLKPVDIDAMEDTLKRYREKKNSGGLADKLESLLLQVAKGNGGKNNGKISIPTRTGVALYAPEDIVYLEADGNYTSLNTVNGDKVYIPHNIGKIEEMLPEGYFNRVGRSYLINMNHLAGFDRKQKTITLMGGEKQIVLSVALKALKKLETYLK